MSIQRRCSSFESERVLKGKEWLPAGMGGSAPEGLGLGSHGGGFTCQNPGGWFIGPQPQIRIRCIAHCRSSYPSSLVFGWSGTVAPVYLSYPFAPIAGSMSGYILQSLPADHLDLGLGHPKNLCLRRPTRAGAEAVRRWWEVVHGWAPRCGATGSISDKPIGGECDELD